ncbi:histidine--tRNA ligase [Candidatus Saccharibacteria bacterium]|nr:histidine--tRNA ligase [Candidatus Saccharibacteria bacterium]
MALSTQPYKGARDFYPEDKRLQKYMFKMWRTVVERYGYEEYDAPIIEPFELYLSKTSEEVVNEQTYSFEDRGGRKVTLRPEMTPTVSRMVAAKRQELAYPLRWYSLPNLWRYERPQRGRLREHWQLNVDIFGISGPEADHEIIQVADAIMQAFKAKREMYEIKVNSRKLVNAFLQDTLGVDATQSQSLVRLIDRMHKIDHAEFVAQADAIFSPTQRDEGKSDQLFTFLKSDSLDSLPDNLQNHESINELKKLMDMLSGSRISNARFDPTLMRGFDYYSDIVFEVFDTDAENNRSMFGGGRYDGLVGLFGVEPVPTVGFGMGDVTLQNFLETHKLVPELRPETDAYLILVGHVYAAAQKTIADLREMGINMAVDMSGRKPDKQLKSAVKNGAHFAIFIGEKELADGQLVIKNLHTGKEERHGAERTVSILKDYRQK